MGKQMYKTEELQIVLVDDEEVYLNEIIRVIDGSSGLFDFKYYPHPESFSNCNLHTIHLLILDMFFDRHRRTDDLLDMAREKWQMSSIIFLTNFPRRIYPGMVDPEMKRQIVTWIAKPDFLLNESLLRDAAVGGISRLTNINEKTKERAIDYLKRRDLEEPDTETVTELNLEGISIPLRKKSTIIYNGKTYSIEGLTSHIWGEGETITQARIMFVRRLHEMYHKLLRTRSKFRTPEEKKSWEAIVEVIDVDKYDQMRSVTVPHEIAEIVDVSLDGSRIVRWYGGEKQIVTPEQVPDIDKLDKGQWFTAVVKRQYITDEITEILHVTSIEPPTYNRSKRRAFWNQDQIKGQ